MQIKDFLIMDVYRIIQIAMGITGIVNCLAIAVFLYFVKRGNLKANRVFSFLLLAICLKISFSLLINIQHEWGLPSLLLYYFSEAGYLSFGAILLLYFRALMKKETSFIFTGIMFLPSLTPFIGHFLKFDVSLWFMQANYLVFLLIILQQLKSFYIESAKSLHLEAEKRWMKILYTFFVFIWVCVNLLLIDFEMYFFELSILFTVSFYFGAYYVIKHYWFKQGDVLQTPRYVNSKLSNEEETEILSKLQGVMDDEKLYLDSEVTLTKVAGKISVRPHKLSQVINQKTGMTFNEYINSFRINEIKTIIKLPEHQDAKIASLAYDYGFNSISAFNTAFKKFTNFTPSQYKGMMQNLN